MKNDGWVRIYRELFTGKWEWFGDSNTTYLFIVIVVNANFEETKFRGETIERGQLLTGRKQLSQITGLSEQSIRTSLNKLISTNKVTIKKTNRFSIVTVCNYGKYQQTNQQTNQQLTNNQPTTNQQLTTSKKDKKNKEEKETKNIFIDEMKKYLEIWNEVFGTKGTSIKAISSLYCSWRKEYSFEQILEAIPKWKNCYLGSKSKKPELLLRERGSTGSVDHIGEALNHVESSDAITVQPSSKRISEAFIQSLKGEIS